MRARCLRTSLAALVPLAAIGCVFDWNGEAPAFTVTGEPPPAASLERISRTPSGHSTLMQGPDGAPWTEFCELWTAGGLRGSGRNCKGARLVRLDGRPAIEDFTGDDFGVRYRMLYIGRNDMGAHTRSITLHRPGDAAASDVTFGVPFGPALLYVNSGGDDDVFVYWVLASTTSHFDVLRRDGRHLRTLPVPPGVDPARPAATRGFEFVLSRDGGVLVLRAPTTGEITVYSTLDDSAVSLGVRPEAFLVDDDRAALLTVGDDGLRSVPLAGGPDRVLTPAKIDPATLTVVDGAAYYPDAGGLFRVPLDGSAPASLVAAGALRLLAIGPRGELVTSRDPRDRYIGSAGDGWLGGARFMERGRLPTFSLDGERIHFLEHAATLGTVGDLNSVPTRSPSSAPVPLGTNVHSFAELGDGRVLAVENHVYAGAWNRLVVIDEARATKRWVVPAATEFFVVPGRPEVIADVVSGASGYDIVRAPIP